MTLERNWTKFPVRHVCALVSCVHKLFINWFSEIVRELPERARVIIACNEPETLEEVAFKIFKSNGIRAFGLHHMDPLIAEKRRRKIPLVHIL